MLSLTICCWTQPMQKRFESDPAFQATTLLLQERIPRAVAPYLPHRGTRRVEHLRWGSRDTGTGLRDSQHLLAPVQLLSNGRYHVMITSAGGGYSHWKDLAVTRWREDSTRDPWGTFCYLRDAATGSSGRPPSSRHSGARTPTRRSSRSPVRSSGAAKHDLDAHTEIAVSPEDDIELRRITLTNRSRKRRTIELTSYAEVVLALPAADAQHPGFSNLFVQTEILRDRQAIVCTRRPRSAGDATPWMFHLMAVHGVASGEVSYETDRSRSSAADTPSRNPGDEVRHEALGQPGLRARPDRRHPPADHLEPDESATINVVTRVGETRGRAWACGQVP